jgi:hypothetical protein
VTVAEREGFRHFVAHEPRAAVCGPHDVQEGVRPFLEERPPVRTGR